MAKIYLEDLLERVLFQDTLVLVIDKPAGLAVHPGPGGGPNLESAFDQLRFGYKERPALAHRLDRDTSGCLVLGRNHRALRKLGILFQSGRVKKTYWAIVQGVPEQPEGIVDLPLQKVTFAIGGWRMTVAANGQTAQTRYRLLGRSDTLSWLELRPETGRTHQLRVHCQAMGHPILGDPLYGEGSAPHAPLHLHARAILLPLYEARPPIEVVAPSPPHMRQALLACGYQDPLSK